MKITELQAFFDSIKYNAESDKKDIAHICSLTKTRPNEQKNNFEFDYGMEQTFFIKSFLQHSNAESFFEIGTGRGTSSYAASLIDNIKKITTVDIIPHSQKKHEAINYKPALVSNADLYGMIKFEQKEKISFKHVDDYVQIVGDNKESFDVCFIDGNHDNKSIILNDFNICMKLLKKPGYIIWDDYSPNQFKVKEVVDEISQEHNLKCELIEFRGHMFGSKTPEKNAGEVIMKINENLH